MNSLANFIYITDVQKVVLDIGIVMGNKSIGNRMNTIFNKR